MSTRIDIQQLNDLLLTERVDVAYNNMITNMICTAIRDQMNDIYLTAPSGTRSASSIKLVRRGGGGAWQFELHINTDGTISVVDNSLARPIVLRDPNTDEIVSVRIVGDKTYFTTKMTGTKAVNEILTWLKDNYDNYTAVNRKVEKNHEEGTSSMKLPIRKSYKSTSKPSSKPSKKISTDFLDTIFD